MKAALQDQRYIDLNYMFLEKSDPEVRSGELTLRACDTPEIRVEKERMIREYGKKCDAFQRISQERVARIQDYYRSNMEHAFFDYPQNSIPESNVPLLSLETYEQLLKLIYEKNKWEIDTLIEDQFGNPEIAKNDPYGIYKQRMLSLKTRFRFEYANQEIQYPRITLGWDTKTPQILRIDKSGKIINIW